jgi:hypothetical protein
MSEARPDQARFDIVVGAQPRGEDEERERAEIRAVGEAGATWWLEWVPPAEFDVMLAAIARGPLRIE